MISFEKFKILKELEYNMEGNYVINLSDLNDADKLIIFALGCINGSPVFGEYALQRIIGLAVSLHPETNLAVSEEYDDINNEVYSKTIAESLLDLEKKGIVEREGDYIYLSGFGKQIFSTINLPTVIEQEIKKFKLYAG